MILTIWRHGQAGNAASDHLRELTPGGRDELACGCRQFIQACSGRSLPMPDVVLHSPWVRTTQTSQLITAALGNTTVRSSDALAPGGRAPAVDKALSQLMDAGDCLRHLLLVSHQPLVSRLVDYYLGEFGRVPPLSPGGLATLSLEFPALAGAALLFWALPPQYEPCV